MSSSSSDILHFSQVQCPMRFPYVFLSGFEKSGREKEREREREREEEKDEGWCYTMPGPQREFY